jgi:hypothetical protein
MKYIEDKEKSKQASKKKIGEIRSKAAQGPRTGQTNGVVH